MIPPTALSHDDTAPCVGCGLCCNGTLYARAKVAPGEEETIRAHGLSITANLERAYYQLPCHHESCGRCTIYESRFQVCRSFRCALLRAYQAGDIQLHEARRHVERALELRAAVVAEDGEAATVEERARVRERHAVDVARGGGEPAARRLLNIIALDTYLERWFRNKKDQSGADEPASRGSNS